LRSYFHTHVTKHTCHQTGFLSRAQKKHKHELEHQTLILLSRTLRKPLWGSFNSPLLGPLQTQGVIKKEPRKKFLARDLEFFLPGICISLPDTWNNLPDS
jgi:hypothetical protein